jgi:hypothetical protein
MLPGCLRFPAFAALAILSAAPPVAADSIFIPASITVQPGTAEPGSLIEYHVARGVEYRKVTGYGSQAYAMEGEYHLTVEVPDSASQPAKGYLFVNGKQVTPPSGIALRRFPHSEEVKPKAAVLADFCGLVKNGPYANTQVCTGATTQGSRYLILSRVPRL